MIYWSVSYKENGKEKRYGCFNKKEMIKEYMYQMDRPLVSISELKIWKNGADYTATLNRFLSR